MIPARALLGSNMQEIVFRTIWRGQQVTVRFDRAAWSRLLAMETADCEVIEDLAEERRRAES